MLQASSARRLLALFFVLSRLCAALVVTSPCCKSFHHVPALFGSSIFDEHFALKDVKMARSTPLDACVKISEDVPREQVLLIERGGCNFTTKVLHAQNHGAIAAVVFNNEDSHRWAIAMEADSPIATDLRIPSVFVAHSTGLYLQAHPDVAVTLNATGHVFQRRLLFGPMETLATYVLVSFALLTCAGGLGLTLAVFVTYIQRSCRESAVARLKTVRYSKSPLVPGMFVGSAQLPFELMERAGRNIGQFIQASEAFVMLSNMADSLKASTPELIQAIASRAPDVWPVLQSIVMARRPWQALLEHMQPVEMDDLVPNTGQSVARSHGRSSPSSAEGFQGEPVETPRSGDSPELDMLWTRHSEGARESHNNVADTAPELTPVPEIPRLRMKRYLSVQTDDKGTPRSDATVQSGGAITCHRCTAHRTQQTPLKTSHSTSDLQACRPEFLEELSRERAERRRRFETTGHLESKGSDDVMMLDGLGDDWPQAYLKNMSFQSMSDLAQRFGEGLGMKLPDFELFDNPFSTGQVRVSHALQRLMQVYQQFFDSVSDTAQSCVNTAMNASNSLAASQMARQLREGMLNQLNSLGNSAQVLDGFRFKSTMCAICLEEFNEGELLTQLPCGHLYHPNCIGPWLSTKSLNCPLCKQPAIPDARVEVFERIFGDMVIVLARQWQVLIAVLVCLAMAAVGSFWILTEVSREDAGIAALP